MNKTIHQAFDEAIRKIQEHCKQTKEDRTQYRIEMTCLTCWCSSRSGITSQLLVRGENKIVMCYACNIRRKHMVTKVTKILD